MKSRRIADMAVFIDKSFKTMTRRSEIYEEFRSKGFTKYYNGKPTKRFKKLLRELETLESKEKRAHSI